MCGNMEVNVVLTGDEKYVMPMGVAMYSIVKNLSKNRIANFFLLVSGWGENEEKEIKKLQGCNINIIHVEEYLHYFKEADIQNYKNDYIKSLSPYYRLLIPKILPFNVEKAFYFDADMIADADLSGIYDDMSEDKLLSCVVELVANTHYKTVLKHVEKWEEFEKFNKNRIKYPYFNAGFFLMNVKMARELNLFNQFLDFLKKHPNPPYADQDTLNAICGQKYSDKIIYLSLQWNVFADMTYNINEYFALNIYPHYLLSRCFKEPYIYHYAGPNKPWINFKVRHYGNVWRNYYKFSPFINNKYKMQSFSEISWINFCFIPLIKIKHSDDNIVIKSYLFGFIPIFRKYANKMIFYFFGIPILKIKWIYIGYVKVFLFGLVPILWWEF